MKAAILLAFALAALLFGNCSGFYFVMEQPPDSVPQVPGNAGILLLIKGAGDFQACVSYWAADSDQTACQSGTLDVGYTPVRFNIADTVADFSLTSISVTSGGETRTVNAPVPGLEY